MRPRSMGRFIGSGGGRRGPRQKNQLWIAPVVGALTAMGVGGFALTVDHFVDFRGSPLPIFVGEADTARALLSIIGGAVATLLALIFTVIAVAIQLATGHYTPRALTILLGDKPTHFTIGIFVGTFTYALVVMLGLRVAAHDEVVAGLSVTLAFMLAVVTIGTFAVYSNHIIHSVRATSLIHRIAAETRSAIVHLYQPFADDAEEEQPARVPEGEPSRVLLAPTQGVLVDLDEGALVDFARSNGCVLVLRPPVGAFVPKGMPLVAIHGGCPRAERALDAIHLAQERNTRLDASFGLRQLIDIAARALSTGVNDPTTAVQVIDELHDLLRHLVVRRLRDGSSYDAEGRPLLILRIVDWDEVVALTLDELRRLGADSMAVARRLRAVIEDLIDVSPGFRRASLTRQLELLDGAVERAFHTEFERELARTSDLRGTGF